MKINYDEIRLQSDEKELDTNDIYSLLNRFKKDYRNVGIYKIDKEVFFYRTITRKEFKDLTLNKEINDYQKEEVVCELCTLYPNDYDFETCNAGIPTELSKNILKASFVDSIDTRAMVLNIYRKEMEDLDNQVTCIINEAFPQYDIEEIENWDVEKTSKYLSRAEWKLVHFRGATFQSDPIDTLQQNKIQEQQKQKTIKNKDNNVGKRGKQKLTLEQIEEMKRKYPEMEWGKVITSAEENNEEEINTVAPGLRPGF